MGAQISTAGERAIAVVRAAGEIDIMSAPHLRAQLDAAFACRCPVVLDAEHVSFIDAAGIRVLVAAHRLALHLGTTFTLRRPSRAVIRLLDITDLLAVIDIEQSRHLVSSDESLLRRGGSHGQP